MVPLLRETRDYRKIIAVEGPTQRDVRSAIRACTAILEKFMGSKDKVEIHVYNSTVGVLNAGEIANVEAMSINISALSKAGHTEVAQGLRTLAEAVIASAQLASEQRAEILESLEELSRQAALPPEERMKPGALKALISGVATTIGAAGGAAEVWSTWGEAIRRFFGF